MDNAAETNVTTEVGGIAGDRLRSIIERIERLEEERKSLGDDIKDIYAEAKSAGFDVKVAAPSARASSPGCPRGGWW
jgi:uncharacterized protein (UPF0335 family)